MESDPILILTLGFVGSLPYDLVGARAACAIGAGFKLLSIDLAGFSNSPRGTHSCLEKQKKEVLL